MQNNSHRQELKGKILDTALQMFMRQGIRQVRMDDIARALSISKRTLYEIYENKEQLLMDSVKAQRDKHIEIINQLARNNPNTIECIVEGYRIQMKELSVITPAFFEDINLYKSVKDYLYEEHLKRKSEYRHFIEKGIQEGFFLPFLNYDVITTILDAASDYIMNANMYKEYGMPVLFHNFVVVFLRGVCTQKGITLLDKLMQNVDEKG